MTPFPSEIKYIRPPFTHLSYVFFDSSVTFRRRFSIFLQIYPPSSRLPRVHYIFLIFPPSITPSSDVFRCPTPALNSINTMAIHIYKSSYTSEVGLSIHTKLLMVLVSHFIQPLLVHSPPATIQETNQLIMKLGSILQPVLETSEPRN